MFNASNLQYFLRGAVGRVRRFFGRMAWAQRLRDRSPGLRALDSRLRMIGDPTDIAVARGSDSNQPAAPPDVSAAKARDLAARKDYNAAADMAVRCIEHRIYDIPFLYEAAYWMIYVNRLSQITDILWPAYSSLCLTSYDRMSEKDRSWWSTKSHEIGQEILGKGGLHECVRFFYLADILDHRPVHAFCIHLAHIIRRMRDQATELGEPLSKTLPEGPRNVVAYVVWGEEYVRAFLEYHMRSMLAPGNLPALAGEHNFVSIVTTTEGRRLIEAHPITERVKAIADIRYFIFPEFLTESTHYSNPDYYFYLLYGMLDHVNIFFAKTLGANVFFLPVDAIVANGSIKHMRRYMQEGFDSCGNSNLVAKRETFLPALDVVRGGKEELVLSTRELATLALQHAHQYVTSQLVIPENQDFGKWARELFWPTADGIVSHSIYTHPLCVSAKAITSPFQMSYKWVDFFLTDRLFPAATDVTRFKVATDPNEVYINNFAPESRRFETTGKPFEPGTFVAAHLHSRPVHRHMMTQRQIIPCDTSLRTNRNPDEDVATIIAAIQEQAPL